MTENDPTRSVGRHAEPDDRDDDAVTVRLTPGAVAAASDHRRPRLRIAVISALAVLALGGAVGAGVVIDRLSAQSPVAAAPAPAVVVPPPIPSTPPTTTSPARASSASPTSSHPTTRRTTRAAPAADTGPGCGQRAVSRGVFNPACAEYQGYLDPGLAGGRQPSSGDIQTQYACDKGLIPRSQCPH